MCLPACLVCHKLPSNSPESFFLTFLYLAPAAAAALLGKSGAAAMLILLFLAVTSATSAELIAVSSILTYDVYKV